ncbi:MAG: site-2 protease family protein [Candidatus Omnitrophica bacterium]|nr:site-2 protease family protein [Candidatus Omnitrophota bacterium]
MKGSVHLFKVGGINIDIHITFLLLPLIFGFNYGLRGVFVIFFVFFCVTVHELMHSLQAKRFGVKVDQIILLPIGGMASLRRIPDNPKEEFIVAISGPLFNILFALIFFFPLYKILGPEDFFHPSLDTWGQTFAYAFWINPLLAFFNLLPAFPMDGGRILRAFLAQRMSYQKATRIAVQLGHIFAILFIFLGIRYNHLLLVIIAFFVYFAASQEGAQVDLRMVLRRFFVSDILNPNFTTVSPRTTIEEILGLIFHTHQEDFPVVEEGNLVGFLPRGEIIFALHQKGRNVTAGEIMRKDFPVVGLEHSLHEVHTKLENSNLRALPVVKEGRLLGMVTWEDIGRIYSLVINRAP